MSTVLELVPNALKIFSASTASPVSSRIATMSSKPRLSSSVSCTADDDEDGLVSEAGTEVRRIRRRSKCFCLSWHCCKSQLTNWFLHIYSHSKIIDIDVKYILTFITEVHYSMLLISDVLVFICSLCLILKHEAKSIWFIITKPVFNIFCKINYTQNMLHDTYM